MEPQADTKHAAHMGTAKSTTHPILAGRVAIVDGDTPETTSAEHEHLLERMKDVACEVIDAETKHGHFHSAHEGLAVIEEEFIELRTEVFIRKINYKRVYAEAMQLAAMGVKMMQLAKDKGGF